MVKTYRTDVSTTFFVHALVLLRGMSIETTGKISSYQVKLSIKRTFHHFMSTGATEKSLHSYLDAVYHYTKIKVFRLSVRAGGYGKPFDPN